MKIAIYSPYLDTAGGGEKYMLTIGECLVGKEQVDVLLDNHLEEIGTNKIIENNEFRHGLDLSKINFVHAPIGVGSSMAKRLIFLRKYDWIFYLTDGSVFPSTAKNSILHFQVPFKNSAEKGLAGRAKLKTWKLAIYNSQFTKEYVESSWPLKGIVVYPPVSLQNFKPLKKKKQILSVGRFASHVKSKKQEFMIEAFKKLARNDIAKDWSLHLAGGAGKGDKEYLEELEKLAKGSKVIIHPNLSIEELAKLYGETSIYWHAMGFGETDPAKMEHFGISTVEAMAAGCVPVVINLGGQREIVENDKNGYLWNSEDELIKFTVQLMENEKLVGQLSRNAQNSVEKFSKERFCREIKEIVYGSNS